MLIVCCPKMFGICSKEHRPLPILCLTKHVKRMAYHKITRTRLLDIFPVATFIAVLRCPSAAVLLQQVSITNQWLLSRFWTRIISKTSKTKCQGWTSNEIVIGHNGVSIVTPHPVLFWTHVNKLAAWSPATDRKVALRAWIDLPRSKY